MNDISPQILAVVEGFLPSLVLLIFISITKPIIELLYSHQGESSYSRIEWMTMATYWGFLIFNVFLVSTIGGAILKVILFRGFALRITTQPCVSCVVCRVVSCGLQVLDDFIENPRSIINLLASSLPQQSGFFINYLLIAGTKKGPPNTTRGQEELIKSLCHHLAHLLPRLWSSPAEALPAARTRPAHLHHHPLQARHRTRGAHTSPVALIGCCLARFDVLFLLFLRFLLQKKKQYRPESFDYSLEVAEELLVRRRRPTHVVLLS